MISYEYEMGSVDFSMHILFDSVPYPVSAVRGFWGIL
jgi:hypothetical protein